VREFASARACNVLARTDGENIRLWAYEIQYQRATSTLMTLFRTLAAVLLFVPVAGGAAFSQVAAPVAARVIGNDHLDTPDPGTLELTRPVRTWEFLSAIGTRAGIFGNESGRVEAWVYPLKLFRDFHLCFRTEGKVLDADSLARTVTVHPESTTILYTGDTFSVKETFFVPVNEPGAIIQFEIETESPLEIEAAFHRDFTLEWPAALGATYIDWETDHHAFYFGEEQKKYSAFVGSPTAMEARQEFQTNYSNDSENSFRLGVTEKGKDTKLIVLAASVQGRADAEAIYRRLTTGGPDLRRASAEYYRNYLEQTVSVDLPDEELQRAYDWSRISMVQGMVTNPYLGTGLVAGYRTSGESQRPGFAWFFGRDSMWTSLALIADGDFASTRKALEFIAKYQRDDGKIPHEIAQGANFVNWFTDYPYAYASADATPLYIITMNDYVTKTGDTAFAQAKWDSAWKAYQFLRSTYDPQGLPQNFGFGHGWIEGGPLLPVKTELYQSALGAEALHALANLAHAAGKETESKDLAAAFESQKTLVNKTFWLPAEKRFAFALDKDGKPVDEATVLSTVPMWFGLLDEDKAASMITQLSDADHQTDWGMRIISNASAKFSGGGYHYGSVWPLFTGWASVGEYRYHHEHAAYGNLRANALLALDGSPGHVTEVLSGDYYQPLSTSSPHQIWSAAMVVSPLLKGMLGLSTDARSATVTLAPHLPADWNAFSIHNLRAGVAALDFHYSRAPGAIELRIENTGTQNCTVEFNPAVSLRAKIRSVEMNGRAVQFHLAVNPSDQHVVTSVSAAKGTTTLRIRLTDDFGVSYHAELPQLGTPGEGLRIISEEWTPSRDQLTLSVSSIPGRQYQLEVADAAQVESVDGAEWTSGEPTSSSLRFVIPADQGALRAHATITFRFARDRQRGPRILRRRSNPPAN
jgi:glycogen debranching enzyme